MSFIICAVYGNVDKGLIILEMDHAEVVRTSDILNDKTAAQAICCRDEKELENLNIKMKPLLNFQRTWFDEDKPIWPFGKKPTTFHVDLLIRCLNMAHGDHIRLNEKCYIEVNGRLPFRCAVPEALEYLRGVAYVYSKFEPWLG